MSLDDIQLDIVVTLQGLPQIDSLTKSLSGVSKAASAVRTQTESNVGVNVRSIRSWNDLTDQLGSVERQYDAVFRAGVHMTQMGSDLMRWARGITGMLGGAVNEWGDFEFALNKAAAASQIFDPQAKMYEALKDSIYDAAAAMRVFPVEDVAQGVYYWASTTGQQLKNLKDLKIAMTGVKAAMKTAAITQTDYESAIKGSYSIMKQYGMNLKDIPKIMAELHVETQRTSLEFGDLVQAFSYMGPLAHSLGMSFEDVARYMGMLGDLGQRGSRAGRAFGMMMTILVRPTDKEKDALNSLFEEQLHVKDGWDKMVFKHGKFAGMDNLIKNLAKATKGLTQQQRLNALTTIIGTQNSARVILPLIQAEIEAMKKGKHVFEDSKYSVEGATKAWRKSFKLLKNSWKGVAGLLQQTVTPIVLEVGRTIAKALTPFVKKAAEVLKQVRKWVQANPAIVDLGVKIAAMAAIALGAAGALLLLGGTLLYVIGNVLLFAKGIGRVMTPFVVLGALIGGLVYAIRNNINGIGDAFQNFITSARELYDAIMGDGKQFSSAWDSFWKTLEDIGRAAVGVLATALNTLSDWMHALASNKEFIGFVRSAVGVLVPFRAALYTLGLAMAGLWAAGRALSFFMSILKILTGYTMLKMLILNIAAAFLTMVRSLMAVRAAFIAGGIIEGLNALVLALGGPAIVSAVATFIGAIGSATAAMWAFTVSLLANPIVLAVMAIVAVVTLLFLAWQNDWLGIREIVGNVSKFVVDTVGGTIGNIIGFFAQLPGRVITFVQQMVTNIVNWLANLREHWFEIWGYLLGRLVGFIAQVIYNVGKWMLDMIGAIGDGLSKLPGLFADMVRNVLAWVASLPGMAMDIFASWMGQLGQWFGRLAGQAGPWTVDFIRVVVNWFARLPGMVWDILTKWAGDLARFFYELPGKLWDAITSIGKAIVDGILKGIGDAWNGITTGVHDFFAGFIQGVKDQLGIASPSKVFGLIGAQTADGFALGIRNNPAPLQAISDTVTGMKLRATTGGAQVVAGLTSGWEGGAGRFTGAVNTTMNAWERAVYRAGKHVKGTGADSMSGFIQTVKDARDGVKMAGENLRDALKHPLSKTKEIAKLEGKLTGKMLKRGLHSSDPAVREAARAYKKAIEDRLFALRHDVTKYGHQTGQNYGDALKDKRAEVYKDAGIVSHAVSERLDMQGKAYDWGQNLVTSFYNGMLGEIHMVETAAGQVAFAVSGKIGIMSPAKEGPLRNLMKYGPNLTKSFASGMLKNLGAVDSAAGIVADTVSRHLSDKANTSLSAELNGSASFESSGVRTLRIELDVTSTDGSLDKESLKELKSALKSSDMVRALERMAEAG